MWSLISAVGFCQMYTPPIHPLYTPYSPPIHPLYTPIHPLYTPYTPPIHPLYTPHTPPYTPNTPPARYGLSHVARHVIEARLLSYSASYDVASNICQANCPPRHPRAV